jgi:hypothetical protein
MNKNNILLKAIDTNFNTSQFTVVLNFLIVTDYVKIPALRDTLAEKRVTKILKCFTISAASCIYFLTLGTRFLLKSGQFSGTIGAVEAKEIFHKLLKLQKKS